MEKEKIAIIIITILKVVAIVFLVCLIVLNIKIIFKEEPMITIKESTTESSNNSYNFWENELTFCLPNTVTRYLIPSIIANVAISICAIVGIIIPISSKKIKALIVTLTLIAVIVSLFIPVVNSYQTYDYKRLTYLESCSIITYYSGKTLCVFK